MRIALWLLISPAFLTNSAFGWGCDGHQMIALITRMHLTPAASESVDRLLHENPIDPALNRYCRDRPDDPIADSATWADDVRNIEKNADWHYIDIPRAVTAPKSENDALKWCAALPDGRPGCIVTAIETQSAILRDPNQSAAARAKALRYIIHFFGDLTQPLHDTDNQDRGGNCTSLTFFAVGKPQNLHGIWDSQLIAHELEAAQTTPAQYAEKLDEAFRSHWSEWGQSKPDLLAWAWEGHKLAVRVAYGDLKPAIPLEPPSAEVTDQDACDAERDKVAELHITIDDRYATDAMPVIREQLAKAGYRLAGFLNGVFR